MTLQFGEEKIELTDLQRDQLKVVSKTIADLSSDIGINEPILLAESYVDRDDFERLLLPILSTLISDDSDVQDINKRIEALSTDDLMSLTRMAIYLDIARLEEPITQALSENKSLIDCVNNPSILQRLNIPIEGNAITRKVSAAILRKHIPALLGSNFFDFHPTSIPMGEEFNGAYRVKWNRDGRFLAAAVDQGVFIYDMYNKQIKHRFYDNKPYKAKWSRCGSLLALLLPRCIEIRNIDDAGELKQRLEIGEDEISTVKWSPDNNRLAVQHFEGKVMVYNLPSDKIEHIFVDYGPKRLKWNKDSSELAINGMIYSLTTGRKIFDVASEINTGSSSLLNVGGWQPNGNLFAFPGRKQFILRDASTQINDIIDLPEKSWGCCNRIFWKTDGKQLFIIPWIHASVIYLFDLSSRKLSEFDYSHDGN
jgi:WD40 repeat protein